MSVGGRGHQAVIIMWLLTAVTSLFVIFRTYCRLLVVHRYASEDHIYNVSFIFLVCYTSCITVAAHYGFGQNINDVHDPAIVSKAMLFESIGQTFINIGMATAKWSLGLFLLHFGSSIWHKLIIWTSLICLACSAVANEFVFWLDCTPPAYFWDRTIPGGKCHIDPVPSAYVLSVLCIVVDFTYAILPWVFIWKLQINMRKKIFILATMSLSVLAGGCGILRTRQMHTLGSANYLQDTVKIVVWSAAENAVTMICIGIPLCRRLYERLLEKFIPPGIQGLPIKDMAAHTLHSIGGTTLVNKLSLHSESTQGNDTSRDFGFEAPFSGSAYTEAFVVALSPIADRQPCDEEAGGNIDCQSPTETDCGSVRTEGEVIYVQNEFSVTSSSRQGSLIFK
ncbi:hypothetical protein F5B20DRAFT_595316 [Whalleya microplaca]|nr:hypothetical protein F5B20DRAFT_595316 [Whalleya microplaca]